jgi:predicted outer membrane repeat protein
VLFKKGRARAMADMKKDFQKAVKAFRDGSKYHGEYPKAMMTAQQMRKGTATINGGTINANEAKENGGALYVK